MQAKSGFTLIEVLVVLFIISIVSGTVLMSISRSHKKDMEYLANDLAQTLTLAQEQAMLQSNVLGLQITDTSFQILAFQPGKNRQPAQWVPLADDVFKVHPIPSGIQITSKLENEAKESADQTQTTDTETTADSDQTSDDQTDKDDKKITPQILISTNGDITPFTLYVGKPDADPSFVIRGESNGSITVKPAGEANVEQN